jgi:hypothetical protein
MDTEKCLANKPRNDEWYPAADETCMNGGTPPKNTALSKTLKVCCERFFFSSTSNCIRKSKRWYPDYVAGHCKNDGNQPSNIAMSETYEICCDRFMSGDADQCYSESKSFASSGDNGMQQNSSSAASTTTTSTMLAPKNQLYYPD